MTERELLVAYHRDGDFAARAEVVERLMALVHHVARRYSNRGEALEDLVQAGALGLLKAVDRFDVDRGVQFSTFAVPNIAGEVRRHFRDRGWAVRVPRDVQERSARLTALANRLQPVLGHAPSVRELAAESELTEEQVLEALAGARNWSADSLDRPLGEDGQTHMEMLGADDSGFEAVHGRLMVHHGMQALAEREQRIIHMRFYEGLTQTEIAERTGISQMHVSRLIRRALEDMQAWIGGVPEQETRAARMS